VDAVGKVGLAIVKRKSPILKEVFDNPENLKVEAHIDNGEIVIRIKKAED
jgi:predicted RNA-binding protein YlqC (UPF0109 family)